MAASTTPVTRPAASPKRAGKPAAPVAHRDPPAAGAPSSGCWSRGMLWLAGGAGAGHAQRRRPRVLDLRHPSAICAEHGPARWAPWFSDARYFVFGFSVWWAVAVALRAWLGLAGRIGAAKRPRGSPRSKPAVAPRPRLVVLGRPGLVAGGQCVARMDTPVPTGKRRVPGGHAGGVVGYTLGPFEPEPVRLCRFGCVVDRTDGRGGRAGVPQFSWLRLAEGIGAWVESLREKRALRTERAEDVRVGEARAARTRGGRRSRAPRLHEDHLPIVIEAVP